MDKSLINSRFRKVVNLLLSRNLIKNKRELAEKLGISSTKLSEILAERMNVSAEIIGKMFTLFPDIPFEYYFIENNQQEITTKANNSQLSCTDAIYCVSTFNTQLPLLPMSAVAGWNGWDDAGVDYNECEKIDIGYLKKLNAEFCIRIAGNSMEPNYLNGDIIACRKLSENTFLQWGKVYLLDSEQGAMLKRLFPTADDDYIECRSDNADYPPFRLSKSEIRSLSVVVGTVRVE